MFLRGNTSFTFGPRGADAKALQELSRRVHVGSSQQELGTLRVYVTGSLADHKNKFGEDYRPEPVQTY